MRLTDEEAQAQEERINAIMAEDALHERERMLETCLRSTVRELLKLMEEDHDDKAIDEYISTWFEYADEESRQYDHIGR